MGGFRSLTMGRRLLQSILVLMVLVFAVQFSRQHGREEGALFLARSLFNPNVEEEVTEVLSSREGSFLLIELKNQGKEPKAYLLINDVIVASFKENPVLLKVSEGDRISLDTRETRNMLLFTILDVSEEIQSFKAREEYRLNPNLYYLGEIRKGM